MPFVLPDHLLNRFRQHLQDLLPRVFEESISHFSSPFYGVKTEKAADADRASQPFSSDTGDILAVPEKTPAAYASFFGKLLAISLSPLKAIVLAVVSAGFLIPPALASFTTAS